MRMPKQSRGFWTCDYCGLQFDRFEEAQYHEVEECQHKYAPSAMAPYDPTLKQYEGGPGYELGHGAQKSQSTAAGNRRFRLMASDETSHLLEPDAVACRNLELFETEEQASVDRSGGGGYRRPRSQIGLRCLQCAMTTTTSAGDAASSSTAAKTAADYSLPRAVNSLGDAVRRLADHHLRACQKLVPQDRWILDHAARTRPHHMQEEGGPSWREDEGNRRALTEFCMGRCQQLGIVDKSPYNSGIEIREQAVSPIADAFETAPISTPPGASGTAEDLVNAPAPPEQSSDAGAGGAPPPPMPLSAYSSPFASEAEAYHPSSAATGPGPPALPMRPQSDAARMPPPPPHAGSPPPPPTDPYGYYFGRYEVPASFPFFANPVEGEWICKYCSHVHPTYRDPHFRWSAPGNPPPPGDFVEYHLSICREYHNASQQQQRQLHPSPPSSYEYSSPYAAAATPGLPPPGSPYALAAPVPPPHAAPPPAVWTDHPPTSVYAARPGTVPSPSLTPHIAAPSPHRYAAPPPAASHHHRAASRPRTTPHAPTRTGDHASTLRAIDFLAANDPSQFNSDGSHVTEEAKLVKEEDKLLLTDFLYYLMKQLRLVRFSEADRKTRGGKRERILIGFGGLECAHCAHIKKARKFFWSGVDRLANSFAEIPGHVFKCKHCPQPIKDALSTLKLLHPEQMARLPRGSQKVFFRRVWQRIHDGDPKTEGEEQRTEASVLPVGFSKPPPLAAAAPAVKQESSPEGAAVKQESPTGTSGSDESILLVDRPTKEAAKALADSAVQSGPPSPSSRVLLAIMEDKDWLSAADCLLRRQLEVFCATQEDIRAAREDRKFPIQEGQVGIRCIHCAMAKGGSGARDHAVSYPFSIGGIFECAREFQRLHLDYCKNLPPAMRTKLASNTKESSTITSIQRKYYESAARGLGLRDAKDGVRAGSESIPVSSQEFFPETTRRGSFKMEEHVAASPAPPRYPYPQHGVSAVPTAAYAVSRKRGMAPAESYGESPRKKSTPEGRRGNGGSE